MNCLESPVAYEIQTTSHCNGRCIICPHRDVVTAPIHMSQALFEKLIDDINLLSPGGEEVLVIPYLNNEPFLDPLLPQRLDWIRYRLPACRLELSTNLSMLREDILDAVVRNRVDDFRVSCFGWEESYEKSMPGLSFDRFTAQLRRLLDRMVAEDLLQAVSLTAVLHPLLRPSDIEAMKALTQKEGIGLNLWGVLDRAGNASFVHNEVNITQDDEDAKRYTCAQRRHLERMHILADGNVIMCCQDWRGEAILGNAAQSTLKSIWFSEAYERFRSALDEPGQPYPTLCKRCKILTEGAKW